MKKNMQQIRHAITLLGYCLMVIVLAACQEKDLPGSAPMQLPTPDLTTIRGTVGGASGYDYELSWPQVPAGTVMQVAIYKSGMQQQGLVPCPSNKLTIANMPTHEPYEFVLKLASLDGSATSQGTIFTYTRPGAYPVKDLKMESVDNGTSFSAKATWQPVADATSIIITATNGERTVEETIDGKATEYAVSGCGKDEVWNFTLVAANAEGKALPVSGSVKVGRTAVGFLSVYATPEELVQKGDDDEASAWLWLHKQHPDADFLPFSTIDSQEKLQKYRVLWWLRDLEGVDEEAVWTMPADVVSATPYIKQWYKDGGSLLLWSHATVYVGTLGRLETSMLRGNDHTIGAGAGGINNDTWRMGVGLNPGGKFSIDFTSHPLYNGIGAEAGDRCKLIPVKGAGWTEDHNCLYFNIPAVLTGKENQDEECYRLLTEVYGIYPLGTWDSQIDFVSQLNIWEARPGNTEFQGTILCIGNGGCEFSMKNLDGTPDKSANPKNNPYQGNILKMATNAIEYLKTR